MVVNFGNLGSMIIGTWIWSEISHITPLPNSASDRLQFLLFKVLNQKVHLFSIDFHFFKSAPLKTTQATVFFCWLLNELFFLTRIHAVPTLRFVYKFLDLLSCYAEKKRALTELPRLIEYLGGVTIFNLCVSELRAMPRAL